jgi:penicillin-binding protein 1C
VITAASLLALGWLALPLVPLPAGLDQSPAPTLVLTDREGRTLRELPAAGHYAASAVPIEQIPVLLRQATLAAEDRRFYSHHGVDFLAVLRALGSQLGLRRPDTLRSGASTITEQLIKLTQHRPRTLTSKIVEALQALRLEQVWSKDRILAAYLNRVDYGNRNIGCVQAADAYFGKPLADLSLAECAFLAALPQSPTRLNPYRHPERARRRQAWVLSRLAASGELPAAELDRARAENPRLCPRAHPFEAPHFTQMLLARRSRAALVQAGGQSGFVRTTLDLELNRFIAGSLRRQVDGLRAEHVGNGAVVVIDNQTAELRALVGSADFANPRAGQMDGAWAARSPGSTIKPFTYLLAIEHGATPADLVADLPAEFPARSAIYRPENYSHRYYGPMRLRAALANSLNISAVKVLAGPAGGPSALQRRLRDCGLTTLPLPAEHYGLGLTLGNAEARLLELTNAYACLARLGDYRPCRLLPTDAPADARLVCDPRAAYLIADVLSDNSARALSFGVDSTLHWEFPVACKTGTSTDFRDNWAIGYTPEFTVGVWMGNFDGRPMLDVSGVTGAGPLLHEIFEHLHAQRPTTWYRLPDGVVEKTVHRVTGHLLPPGRADDPAAMTEKFLAEHLPPAESPADYDAQGRVLLPPEYGSWLASGDNWLAGQAIARADGAIAGGGVTPGGADSTFAVVAPLAGTTYVLDPDLPPSSRLIDLRVRGCAEPHWESPTLECRVIRGRPMAVLQEGRHALRVQDPLSGAWRETWIVVRAL